MSHVRTGFAASILLIALAAMGAPALAQDSIRVTLFRPPPNQLKVADLWRVRIENRTATTFTVYLFGKADEERDGPIVDATSARFQLPPGVKMVNGAEIQPIDANYFNQRYKDVFLRTGQAPTGNYTVCVTVRNAANDADLGTDCYDQRVEVTTPPILVMPTDESTVEERFPAFTWLPPTPLARGSRPVYQLRIVEVLGRQTPYDAITSNPAWFERSSIPNTVFPYPIASRPFGAGRRYAWQVMASDAGFPLGESEIWWFTYNPPKIVVGTDGPGTGRPIGDSGGGGTGGRDSSGWPFRFIDKGIHIVDLGDQESPYQAYRIPGLEAVLELDLAVPPSILDAMLTPCLGSSRGPMFRTGP